MNTCTMKDVYTKFGLQPTTQDFIGHAMALYTTDEYILQKGAARDAVLRVKMYAVSMARYGKSPYIYPLYGLGELPQGFARLSAIYGGTYMLNTKVDEVLYEGSRVSGIRATMREPREGGEVMEFTTRTKKIIADPSYFPGKVQVVGHLLKAICILNHPVASTDGSDSLQLIIPQSQVGRRNGKKAHIYLYKFAFLSIVRGACSCLNHKASWISRTAHRLTMECQTFTSPSSPPRTTSVPRATTSPLSRPSPRVPAITTSSCSPASTVLGPSRRSSWVHRFRSTSLSRRGRATASTFRGAMTHQVISRA